jgi:RNA polymerase sigma-70 factor (ECF subfamily)
LVAPGLDVRSTYDAELDFVHQSLGRLGVPRSDLPDLCQEVFVVVSRRRLDYDPSQPLRPWLFGICVGLVRNARRTRRRKPTVPLEDAAEIPSGGSPLEALAARRRLTRAHQALEAMDPERRAVFVMYEVEGQSGEAIAAALGIPAGTVHSRLFAARKAIAEALAEEER